MTTLQLTKRYHGVSLGPQSHPVRISHPALPSHLNKVASGSKIILDNNNNNIRDATMINSIIQNGSPQTNVGHHGEFTLG